MVRKQSKMKRFRSYIKKNWQKAAFWLLGLIIGLVLTKACNTIWPDTPVVVKEYTDTVNVIHTVSSLQVDSDSITRKLIEHQLMNLELLNMYEEQITGKREAAKTDACKIIVGKPYPNSRGYSTQSASSYCFIELNTNGPFLDITYDFLREDYIDMVNTLGVKISRKDSEEGRNYIVSDMNFEPHKGKNGLLVRMVNDFPHGEYAIEAGFILKENKLDKYPTFYRQVFELKK